MASYDSLGSTGRAPGLGIEGGHPAQGGQPVDVPTQWFPDMPTFDKSETEQLDEILDVVNIREPKTILALGSWLVGNPGEENQHRIILSVQEKTKKSSTPSEKRLSLLYTIHELFKRGSKERLIDFKSWLPLLRDLVPWVMRKQNMETYGKIKKQVLRVWGEKKWVVKTTLEELCHLAKNPPPIDSSRGGSGRRSTADGTKGGGSVGSLGVSGRVGSKRPRSSEIDPRAATRSRPLLLPGMERGESSGLPEGGSVGEEVMEATATQSAEATMAAAALADIEAFRVRVSETDMQYSPLGCSPLHAPLPAPEEGDGLQDGEDVKDELIQGHGASRIGLGEEKHLSGVGPLGALERQEGKAVVATMGVSTGSSSPDSRDLELGSPDMGLMKSAKETAEEAGRRDLKYDGCGLVRLIGRAMSFPVRVMLTALHLFHHYQWCGLSAPGLSFPRQDLPAVCLACLLAASKAEDCNAKLDRLVGLMDRLQPNLPPFESVIFPLGKMPTKQEVINYEYKILLSRGFDLQMQHPTDLLPQVLVETQAPEEVGHIVFDALCSRAYTDCTLCLEEDPAGCLCAAVLFALWRNPDSQFRVPTDWHVKCGVTRRTVLDYTEVLVQSAKELATVAPDQNFMRTDLASNNGSKMTSGPSPSPSHLSSSRRMPHSSSKHLDRDRDRDRRRQPRLDNRPRSSSTASMGSSSRVDVGGGGGGSKSPLPPSQASAAVLAGSSHHPSSSVAAYTITSAAMGGLGSHVNAETGAGERAAVGAVAGATPAVGMRPQGVLPSARLQSRGSGVGLGFSTSLSAGPPNVSGTMLPGPTLPLQQHPQQHQLNLLTLPPTVSISGGAVHLGLGSGHPTPDRTLHQHVPAQDLYHSTQSSYPGGTGTNQAPLLRHSGIGGSSSGGGQSPTPQSQQLMLHGTLGCGSPAPVIELGRDMYHLPRTVQVSPTFGSAHPQQQQSEQGTGSWQGAAQYWAGRPESAGGVVTGVVPAVVSTNAPSGPASGQVGPPLMSTGARGSHPTDAVMLGGQ